MAHIHTYTSHTTLSANALVLTPHILHLLRARLALTPHSGSWKMSVMIDTSLGEVVVDLFCDEAPLAAKNFLKLCKMK